MTERVLARVPTIHLVIHLSLVISKEENEVNDEKPHSSRLRELLPSTLSSALPSRPHVRDRSHLFEVPSQSDRSGKGDFSCRRNDRKGACESSCHPPCHLPCPPPFPVISKEENEVNDEKPHSSRLREFLPPSTLSSRTHVRDLTLCTLLFSLKKLAVEAVFEIDNAAVHSFGNYVPNSREVPHRSQITR